MEVNEPEEARVRRRSRREPFEEEEDEGEVEEDDDEDVPGERYVPQLDPEQYSAIISSMFRHSDLHVRATSPQRLCGVSTTSRPFSSVPMDPLF